MSEQERGPSKPEEFVALWTQMHELLREMRRGVVVFLQGDQMDVARLEELAAKYGPFDIVIDDGSHVTDHVAGTLRCLLPHVRPGGVYIIEDTDSSVRKPESTKSTEPYGEGIWPDFVSAVFETSCSPTRPSTRAIPEGRC